MTPQAAEPVSLQSPQGEIAAAEHHSHPHRSLASRGLGLLGRVSEYSRQLGTFNGIRWCLTKVLARVGVPGMRRVNIQPPDVSHPVEVRMYPSSDDFVFDQIFVQHEYRAALEAVDDARFIVDLGANVGYASVLFATAYPSARILCVEPDPGNYAQCAKNIAPYGNRIEALLGAVWAFRSKLTLAKGVGCDGRDWSTQVLQSADPTTADVEAWDMPALMELSGTHQNSRPDIDILKIDIEGSEAEVFAADTDRWLHLVRNICIEFHGDHCRETFFNALRGYEYDLVNCGEFTLCLNLRRAA
jgi:FkbM family methyltransferase